MWRIVLFRSIADAYERATIELEVQVRRFNYYFKFSRAMTFSAIFTFASVCISNARAEEKEKVFPEAKHFEVLDGTAQVGGEPGNDSNLARAKWQTACDAWKAETKDLNKSNQVVALACGSADCTYQENGNYICKSTATYKIKTEGIRAPPAPAPVIQKTETFVNQAPPEMIYEVRPEPQLGFIWAPGFWGWSGARHVWYPGHWMHEQPGQIWIGNEWNHRGGRWYFESGHWGHRH